LVIISYNEGMRLSDKRGSSGIVLTIVFLLMYSPLSLSNDIYISGSVTDRSGVPVSNANVSFSVNSVAFTAITTIDGNYSVKVSGIYENVTSGLQLGKPFPNPFTYAVSIPFIINGPGDVIFSIYNFAGQKIREIRFPSVDAGSYRINWDGCSQNGSPLGAGFYIFTVTSGGTTRAGKILKTAGGTFHSSSTELEPFIFSSGQTGEPAATGRIPLITEVKHNEYYPVRLTDISVIKDTIIDFVLTGLQSIPFKTSGNYIAMYTDNMYRPMNLKGINLGSSPPGTWPGEIAYAITEDMYEQWIARIGEAGFNSIRIYTLHPPVFYEKLADYNQRHPDNPLLLFQGIWLDEMEDYSSAQGYDLTARSDNFTENIEEVINCIHGKKEIAFRAGKAYGKYQTDISQWTAGYILGREISPQEVDSTNTLHPALTEYSGYQFSIEGASASEVFVTRMLDKAVEYESNNYSSYRPVSISTWPTLDPLSHPTEIYTDEDKATIDVTGITGANTNAGMFISYHAYPYYPNFISEEANYQSYSDSYGQNSYLGYLTALKEHYSNIPLVIGEYGVPSSWGSAHQSFSNMHHGGYSEQQQGEIDVRLMNNIVDADCAGGFIFSWMDEWFKNTWVVQYLEAMGTLSGTDLIPTRQLWQNITSPEQNFGLVAFDQKEVLPFIDYTLDNTSGPITELKATNDNEYFFVEVTTSTPFVSGDTIAIAFDTYKKDVGESVLPNGLVSGNRSEFLLNVVPGKDSAEYYITQAYDMFGLTPRFDLADHDVQKFKSTVTNGAPWNLMRWINDGFNGTIFNIGILPVENSEDFSFGNRATASWSQNKMTIRIPWTMLYFYDPTQMKVIDGAVTYNGGRSYETVSATSDGIALSVSFRDDVINTAERYIWEPWLIVPETYCREKKSLLIVEDGLESIPDFVL